MGAIAAKLGGFSELRNEIIELKAIMDKIEKVVKAVDTESKVIEGSFTKVQAVKNEVESKVGGILGQLDDLKSKSSNIQNSISMVEGLTSNKGGMSNFGF